MEPALAAEGSTWDAEGKAITADSLALTYDALGRMVEQGGTTQIVYSPAGQKFALMAGQTVSKAFVPLPGGAQAVYAGTTLAYFRHPDWLGSSRLTTTTSQTVSSSLSYAPFGETYAEAGTPDRSFTGQNQDTIAGSTAGLYDFLFRQHAQYGRWNSPDPAGFSTASPDNPQSWNRYAYVINNPLKAIDPTGLECTWEDGSFDSAEDPVTGTPGGCANEGGIWVDHSYFVDEKLPDWSGTPNATVATYAQSIVTVYSGPTGTLDTSSTDISAANNGTNFLSSARLPGESVSQCVDRSEKELLGAYGQGALRATSLVSLGASIATAPTLFRAAVPVSPDLFKSAGQFGQAVFRSSFAEAAVFEAATVQGTLPAAAVGVAQKAAGAVFKVAPWVTAISSAIEGGFWLACR